MPLITKKGPGAQWWPRQGSMNGRETESASDWLSYSGLCWDKVYGMTVVTCEERKADKQRREKE